MEPHSSRRRLTNWVEAFLWICARCALGAAIPERLDLLAIAAVVAIAWLIGLLVAEAGRSWQWVYSCTWASARQQSP